MLIAVTLGLGALAGGVWGLTQTLGDRETLYSRQTRYYWVTRMDSPDPSAREQAGAVLTNEILPRLTKVMFSDTNDSPLRRTLVQTLNGLPGVNIYFVEAEGRRAGAAAGMGEFGPAAGAAIPALLQALKGQDLAVHGAAITALGKIHCQSERIVPLLIDYLDRQELRSEAAEALGDYGPMAKAALPKLMRLEKVQDKDLHHAVVEALGKIAPEAGAK